MTMALLFAAIVAVQPATEACAPAPPLVRGPGFDDSRTAFGPASAEFRATVANFGSAYRRACQGGLLQGGRLLRDAGRRDRMLVRNAPDANVASIYVHGEHSAGADLQLEYPFMASDGTVNVPSADDLHEAIYCYVRGATRREEEEEGRCLPD